MYKKLPDTCMNLLMVGLHLMTRLLEKNPKKRITAAEALQHPFFDEGGDKKDIVTSKDSLSNISSVPEERKSNHMRNDNRNNKISIICEKTGNQSLEKKDPKLRDDSCLKFKMKENVMTGRVDETGSTIDQIESPLLKPKESRFNQESRFKKMVEE